MADDEKSRSGFSRSSESKTKQKHRAIQSFKNLLPTKVEGKKFRANVEIWVDLENDRTFCALASLLVSDPNQIHLVYSKASNSLKKRFPNNVHHVFPLQDQIEGVTNLADCYLHQEILDKSDAVDRVILLITKDSFGQAIQKCLETLQARFQTLVVYSRVHLKCELGVDPEKCYDGLVEFFDQKHESQPYYSKLIE